jgi:hypothetical protein
MMAETDEISFDLLVKRGAALGLFVQRHRTYDPCAPGGDLYVMEQRGRWLRAGNTGNPPSLLRYADAETVHEFLMQMENAR